MSTDHHIPFRKMNGLGNDFVILDGRSCPIRIADTNVAAIANRESGIGCDQLIVMEKSAFADVQMRIWNKEGGEVESCGNASRCVAELLLDEDSENTLSVETKGGLIKCSRTGNGSIVVDMGEPKFDWRDIPLAEEFRDTRAIELQIGPIDAPVLHSPSVVNVGNPHCIFWVDDVNAHDLARFGPMLENHPIFPQRANISLAQINSRDHVVLKVWERGAGLTRACGTAACATGAAAIRKKLTDRLMTISLPGGNLQIEWREEDGHILMTGPVAYEFDGVLPEGLLV